MSERKNRLWMLPAGVILVLVLLILILGFVFSVNKVVVEGNTRYTEDEVKQLVVGDGYANALVLLAEDQLGRIGTLPFINEIEIGLMDNHTVKIQVYEKTIVGYVKYLGTNLYFDKDGMVVESTADVLDDVPQISGLKFDEITLYRELPVADTDVFRTILDLTQIMDKNDVHPDRIYFADNDTITLYFGDARVMLGTDDNMDEKIANLAAFVDDLEGRSGVLHMENFSEDTSNIVFDESQD